MECDISIAGYVIGCTLDSGKELTCLQLIIGIGIPVRYQDKSKSHPSGHYTWKLRSGEKGLYNGLQGKNSRMIIVQL